MSEGPPTDEEATGDADEGRTGHRRGPFRSKWAAVAAIVVLVAVGVGLGLGVSGGGGSRPTPEGVPIQNAADLASADSTVSGTPVDGITCRKSMDQGVSYHIHAHVTIFVDGKQARVPAGAGIVAPRIDEPAPGGVFVDNDAAGCLYWLHVHANDGIIHVEAPNQRSFILGQFFDIWNQPLRSDQVGPARGTVVAFVDGARFQGDPRNIPLVDREDIQLDVGTPVVPFQPLKFTVTGSCATSCGPPTTR